jgi:tubulin polyglutamylase TTLL1
MDFMIDAEFKPWLIEINTNPCLELSSPLLAKLIPAMVDNSLRISIDLIYLPSITNSPKKVEYQVDPFYLVFDELIEGA